MIVLRKNRYVKDDNLHRCHIRQCVAEDPGLMHRVKKVAFRTRLQSVMSPRVYNHHFFTRNNSCLDLKRQCHAPKVGGCESGMTPTVLPHFPSTGPKLMSCPCWYTRSAFPVPTHLLFHLVHQKHVSCTNGAPQYIRCIQRPHHVHFLFYGAIGDPFFQV